MPKRRKPSKTKPEPVKTGEEHTYDVALRYLRDQIQAVIDGTAPKTKHDPAYRVATLTRMIAQVDAERRKATAAEKKRLEKINRTLVLAWARAELDKAERRSIARELIAIDDEGSILA